MSVTASAGLITNIFAWRSDGSQMITQELQRLRVKERYRLSPLRALRRCRRVQLNWISPPERTSVTRQSSAQDCCDHSLRRPAENGYENYWSICSEFCKSQQSRALPKQGGGLPVTHAQAGRSETQSESFDRSRRARKVGKATLSFSRFADSLERMISARDATGTNRSSSSY